MHTHREGLDIWGGGDRTLSHVLIWVQNELSADDCNGYHRRHVVHRNGFVTTTKAYE